MKKPARELSITHGNFNLLDVEDLLKYILIDKKISIKDITAMHINKEVFMRLLQIGYEHHKVRRNDDDLLNDFDYVFVGYRIPLYPLFDEEKVLIKIFYNEDDFEYTLLID
jgi:hypothetical protein